jgi:hypothetical protein
VVKEIKAATLFAMRIALILTCVLLAGCSTAQTAYTASNGGSPGAQAYCMKKGFAPGTYNFSTCYENRPEVQMAERNDRLASMNIILQNRSTEVSSSGKSYPVE